MKLSGYIDNLILELGSPGRYQICIFILLTFNYFPVTFNHILMAFYGSTPKYTCINSYYENMTLNGNGTSAGIGTTSAFNNDVSVLTSDLGKCSSSYTLTNGRIETVNCMVEGDGEFRYEKRPVEETIVTEVNFREVMRSRVLKVIPNVLKFSTIKSGSGGLGLAGPTRGQKQVKLGQTSPKLKCLEPNS